MNLKMKPKDEKERLKREMIRKLEAKIRKIPTADAARNYHN